MTNEAPRPREAHGGGGGAPASDCDRCIGPGPGRNRSPPLLKEEEEEAAVALDLGSGGRTHARLGSSPSMLLASKHSGNWKASNFQVRALARLNSSFLKILHRETILKIWSFSFT